MKNLIKAIVICLLVVSVGLNVWLIAGNRIVKKDVGLRPAGNNNWQVYCHAVRANGIASDKLVTTLNVNTVDYGTKYATASKQCTN